MIVNVLLQYDTELETIEFNPADSIAVQAHKVEGGLDLEKHQCECEYHNCGMEVQEVSVGEIDSEEAEGGWVVPRETAKKLLIAHDKGEVLSLPDQVQILEDLVGMPCIVNPELKTDGIIFGPGDILTLNGIPVSGYDSLPPDSLPHEKWNDEVQSIVEDISEQLLDD